MFNVLFVESLSENFFLMEEKQGIMPYVQTAFL